MVKRYLLLLICLFISALCFNILQYPHNIVSGGIPGIAIIVNKCFNIKPSLIIFLISIGLFIISYILLGKTKTISSITSTFVYPLFIKLTTFLNNYDFINNMLIISILIGLITGSTVGLIYRIGFNNGGISVIIEILAKYLKINLSIINFIINILIVLLGWFIIGGKMLIYSTIILIVNSLMIQLLVKRKNI